MTVQIQLSLLDVAITKCRSIVGLLSGHAHRISEGDRGRLVVDALANDIAELDTALIEFKRAARDLDEGELPAIVLAKPPAGSEHRPVDELVEQIRRGDAVIQIDELPIGGEWKCRVVPVARSDFKVGRSHEVA